MPSSFIPELASVADFLSRCLPFDRLPAEEVQSLVPSMQITYYRKGHSFRWEGADSVHRDGEGLHILRSGAAEVRDASEKLLDRLGEGDSFDLAALNTEQPDIRVLLIEDALLYFLKAEFYRNIRKKHRPIDRFFHTQKDRRIRRAARYQGTLNVTMGPLSDYISREVFAVEPQQSIQLTAQQMTQRRLSSALIMEGDRLMGIVTDRDIRSRAVAEALDVQQAVSAIMTPAPVCVESSSKLFDAILLMTRQRCHHLPVVENHQVVGIVSASDILRAREDDPLFLVQHISRATSVEGLKHLSASLPNLVIGWVKAKVPAVQVAHLLTAIGDALTVRLIQLSMEELGPAPAPFCWLCFGSQARGEQLLGADQDNGLVIADEIGCDELPWFEELANRVCEGLNRCGYPYCRGEVMASNSEWRQCLSVWKKTVDNWAHSPTPEALMRVSIFFDLRGVYGDRELCEKLQEHMLERARANTIFLAALAENVLSSPPPLGFFRRFVVERNGQHRHQLDLKKRAVLPLVDMVRIHALANGISVVNTLDRLQALIKGKVLSMACGRNMEDVLSLLTQLRIDTQAQQVRDGEDVDNYLDPDKLPSLEKNQLRDGFSVIAEAQGLVRTRYRAGLG